MILKKSADNNKSMKIYINNKSLTALKQYLNSLPTPREQSDLGPYYVQYQLSKNKSRQGADDRSREWQAKG